MSRNPKFDAYFNLLNNDDVKEIQVPASNPKRLAFNVHVYQNAAHRNKKGLFLGTETRLNPKTQIIECWVVVKGDGRTFEEKKKEPFKVVKIGECLDEGNKHDVGVSKSGRLWAKYPDEDWKRLDITKLFV